MFSERSLIETILAPLTRSGGGALGLADDAAFIRPRAGYDLVITQDSLQEGVHFLPADPPDQVAQKALRVNLSDICAKGAEPRHYLLSLFIPAGMDEAALRGFADGLARDQESYGIELLGGDTVRSTGGFGLTVTMSGEVPGGRMVHRSGAAPGDIIYVSGTIGDAVLGLKILSREIEVTDQKQNDYLVSRYRLPRPPVSLAPLVREFAGAAMDISDGLAGDLSLLSRASGVSAEIDCARLPLSPAAEALISAEPGLMAALISGGDDYQILCTVPEARCGAFERAAGGAFRAIGQIEAGTAPPRFTGRDGKPMRLDKLSYAHF
ncbi:MAG: thiamine-phosphate kinase [Hyphomicrobiales bacterium]|nr:MAG: thiamine-phosphate kinase [Hyphomicrobiales bacterium]